MKIRLIIYMFMVLLVLSTGCYSNIHSEASIDVGENDDMIESSENNLCDSITNDETFNNETVKVDDNSLIGNETQAEQENKAEDETTPEKKNADTMIHFPVKENFEYPEWEDVLNRLNTTAETDLSKPLNVAEYYVTDMLYLGSSTIVLGIDGDVYSFLPNSKPNFTTCILAVYPEMVFRKMDNGNIYGVLDGNDGTRVFVFFKESNHYMYSSGYPVITKGKLCYNDFSDIHIGDTIDKVIGIDSTAKHFKETCNLYPDGTIQFYMERGNPFASVHLLTDGILKYTYERSGEEGNYVYTIVDIEYHENFKMEGLGGVTDYSIAEIDYVD